MTPSNLFKTKMYQPDTRLVFLSAQGTALRFRAIYLVLITSAPRTDAPRLMTLKTDHTG